MIDKIRRQSTRDCLHETRRKRYDGVDQACENKYEGLLPVPALYVISKSALRRCSRRVTWLVLVTFWAVAQPQQRSNDLHGTDFKNFSYPWMHPSSWPDYLQWMSLRLQQHIRLVNGRWEDRDEGDDTPTTLFSGLTLEQVEYGHLSTNMADDAIVILRYDSGGTQNHYWVYVYGQTKSGPKLLGFFHAGDRGHYGLDRVFVKNQVLHV